MPSPRPSEAPFDLLVEALEPRIAPTGLVGNAGSIANASDPNFLAYNIAPTPGHLGFTPQGNGVYAIQLSGDGTANGDKINVFNNATGFTTFLQANNGQVLAFFKDFNNDGQVSTSELVGLSMGQASAATVNGSVNGDVVANLAADGHTLLDQNPNTTGETIIGFRAVNVTGSIIAGGGLANLSVSQGVNQVLAGTAASGYAYHFNGDPNGAATGVYSVPAPGIGQSGGAITNVSFGAVNGIHSGDGGLNAAGGAITGVLLNADTNGFLIQSGAGGAGAGAKGGSGGLISNVTVGLQPNSNDPTAHDPILIQGGAGGGGEVGFKSGAGGSLDNVAVGFSINNSGIRVQSAFLLSDNVTLHAGTGGDGFQGGTGGAVTNSLVYVGTPDNPGGASATDPAVVKILGGDGGAQVSGGLGGKGGKGGGVSTVDVRDLLTDATRTTFTGLPAGASATHTQVLVEGGDGGQVLDSGKGKFGGSVSDVTFLGYRLDVTAGDGADGVNAGGAGGGITGVNVLSRTDLLPTELILDAGHGGNAANGFAGSGGALATVRVNDSNLANLIINDGTHANGGQAQGNTGGTGGAGGAVSDVIINGSRPFFNATNGVLVAAGNAVLRAGDGGLGPNGGGAGGSIDTLQLTGSNFRSLVTAGSGGIAFASGGGGLGGNITGAGISNEPLPVPTQIQSNNAPDTSLELRAGSGGDANTGPGGAGGTVTASSLVSTQNAVFTAGAGGSGVLGAAGAGGSVTTSQAFAAFGSVTVTAGSAGPLGGAGGAGGSIDTFVGSAGSLIANINARPDVSRGNFTLTAGDGHAGGAGGSVINSGATTLPPGSVLVTAGNGSGQNATAGAGGSVDGFTGFVGGYGATRFTAGNGGNGNGAVGAGGSVSNVSLTGGLGQINPPINPVTNAPTPVALTFDAGNGGDAGGGRKGGNGGNVNNVTVASLAANTVLHHVAAGDGGNGQVKGGKGGSVTNLRVGLPVQTSGGLPGFENADIGVRSGAVYGYDPTQDPVTGAFRTAGGIFAGAGGAGQQAPRPGSVTDVNAAAIASIVAGKAAAPQLVNTVDRITLNGLSAAQVNSVGDFTNFNQDLVVSGTLVQALKANVVGSVVNPAPGGGGSTFKFVDNNGDGVFTLATDTPIDGLIAAINLTQNRNFQPEALLSVDPNSGQLQLVDLRAPNTAVVNNA